MEHSFFSSMKDTKLNCCTQKEDNSYSWVLA